MSDANTALVVGRFQPFHRGHQELIDILLKEGKQVVVAIRGTKISPDNPYSVLKRIQMIKKVYGKNKALRFITIPDISEVVYGRNVGYKIRKIKHKYSHISATNIRKETNNG